MSQRKPALVLIPITLSDAHIYVRRYHRHHRPAQGGLFAIACAIDGSDDVCGVAVIGRPVSRMLDDGFTAEVVRVATDGTPNACSCLYGAAWRAARAMGWRRLITYTLSLEHGSSLRGAGWKLVGEAGGGSWSSPSRPRIDRHPKQKKLRWEVAHG